MAEFIFFLILLIVGPSLASWTFNGERSKLLGVFVLTVVISWILFVKALDFRKALGVESFPESESTKVLAIDTTNNQYFNIMIVDGDKDVKTYALPKKFFEATPRKGNTIVLVEIDGARKFLLK